MVKGEQATWKAEFSVFWEEKESSSQKSAALEAFAKNRPMKHKQKHLGERICLLKWGAGLRGSSDVLMVKLFGRL